MENNNSGTYKNTFWGKKKKQKNKNKKTKKQKTCCVSLIIFYPKVLNKVENLSKSESSRFLFVCLFVLLLLFIVIIYLAYLISAIITHTLKKYNI